MKKIALLLAIIFTLTSIMTGTLAFAEDTKKEEDNSIIIKFKVGDDVLSINGKDAKVVTPYVVDGTTLVPVRVITESFGAEVLWDDATQKVTVKYSEIEIELTIGNKTAYINKNATELLAAPELKDGSTMLPLRFITEAFGADVSFDEKEDRVLVIKEMTESNSIKDYASILKRSTKEKVGDSFYGWSMNRNSELKLKKRSFDGQMSLFASSSREASINVSIDYTTKDTNINQVYENYKKLSEKYTIINIDKTKTKSGQDMVLVKLKDDELLVELRTIVSDKYTYILTLIVNASEGNKAFDEFSNITGSFDVSFDKKTVEDLTDVEENNMHTFDYKNLGLKLSIPGEYYESKDNDNSISFYNHGDDAKSKEHVSIGVYSNKEGHTYMDWAKTDLKDNSENFNPELTSYSELRNITVDGKKAVYYDCTTKYDAFSLYSQDIFIENGDYFVNIAIYLEAKGDYRERISKIIGSIKISEIDYDKIGSLVRVDRNSEETKEFSLANHGVKISAPISWTQVQSSSSSSLMLMDLNNLRIAVVSVIKFDNATSVAKLAQVGVDIARDNGYTLLQTPEPITFGNNQAYYIIMEKHNKDTNLTNIVEEYYIVRNKTGYVFSFSSIKIGYGEKTKNVIKQMMESIKFE